MSDGNTKSKVEFDCGCEINFNPGGSVLSYFLCDIHHKIKKDAD